MMIFGGPPRRITSEELRRALGSIDRLDQEERDQVWMIFAGDMDEDGQFSGIDQGELTRRLAWMRANMRKHKLDEDEITQLEQKLTERI